jgi:hypothetical protein
MTSIIKVDNLQNQCGANIINENAGTITIGASGDTITLACGASQTGFGRTGTVDWDTTAKTASFTAVSGNGYFVNTTSGAITVTLPAGSAGDIVGISDYASTFQTNNVTIAPNGSDNINGANESATLSTQGIAVSLVYVDATRGWKSVTGSDNDTTGTPPFIVATGGTITTCGDYRIHTFTGPGTFCVSAASGPTAIADYLVVAGGGGGGGCGYAGGGGAGGYRESHCATTSGSYTASPLATPISLPVSVQGYPITVGSSGAGGTPGAPQPGTNGSNSIFSTITSAGGGGGGGEDGTANPGGSGGGSTYGASGGVGNVPPVSPPQGNDGGSTPTGAPTNYNVSGGGGAGAAGASATPTTSGNGGNGVTSSINTTPTTRAGGGGGGTGDSDDIGSGGTGGGGAGGGTPNGTGSAGTINTGGGGGGGGRNDGSGGAGGSGIVIIRYKFQ